MPHLQDCFHGEGLRHGGLYQRALWGELRGNLVKFIEHYGQSSSAGSLHSGIFASLASCVFLQGILFLGQAFVQLIDVK